MRDSLLLHGSHVDFKTQGDSPKIYAFYSIRNLQKKCVNPLDFNSPRIHKLLEIPHPY